MLHGFMINGEYLLTCARHRLIQIQRELRARSASERRLLLDAERQEKIKHKILIKQHDIQVFTSAKDDRVNARVKSAPISSLRQNQRQNQGPQYLTKTRKLRVQSALNKNYSAQFTDDMLETSELEESLTMCVGGHGQSNALSAGAHEPTSAGHAGHVALIDTSRPINTGVASAMHSRPSTAVSLKSRPTSSFLGISTKSRSITPYRYNKIQILLL